jgi:uncharacterized membrane protein YkoI
MRHHSVVLSGIAVLAAVSAFSASKLLADEKDEQKVAVSDVPSAVIDAAKKTIAGAEITDAEKKEKKGVTAYELDVTGGSTKYELLITADGNVLSQEQDIAAKDLPDSVVAGIKKDMPDAQITGAEKQIKKGKTGYEVDVKSNGKSWEAKLDADGNLLSKKIDDDND